VLVKKEVATRLLSQPLINGVLLPTLRSQVKIFIKQEKLFFEIAPCDSELNGRLTTSEINGVQSTDPRY
ncbi:hypothetical protein ACPTI3_14805, partial [Enterococcus faecium]|uniref:hypothetical protein n=1 Tax=Enterococcus faecium TaxID=1352 RepID=UPI003CC6D16E